MNFDLARMRRVMQALGHPENYFPAVHVAGTNGKGSVTALVASILRVSGLKVGMYTSPHLEKVNERFQINGESISDRDYQRLYRKLSRQFPHLTQFELFTALAFCWFHERNIDIAVVEVGLGGRLDATNVLKNVLVSVITTIDFDHMDWLGNTLEKIAFEKAGIIKSEVPLVTGARGKAFRVIASIAKRQAAEVFVPQKKRAVFKTSLEGVHQQLNQSIALEVIDILRQRYFQVSEENVVKGLRDVHWPGRFERFLVGSAPRKKVVVLDGAHNAAGCKSLVQLLKERKMAPVDLLFGVLKDKNVSEMVNILSPVVHRCVVVPVKSDRSSDPRIVSNMPLWKSKTERAISAESGLDKLLDTNDGRPIVVAGSLYLVGEVRRMIR